MNKKDEKQIKEDVRNYLIEQHHLWIEKEWRENHNRDTSQNKFAEYLDLPPTTLSRLINRYNQATDDNLFAIASRLGPEIFRIAGRPARMPDDPLLAQMAENWHRLEESDQQAISDFMDRLLGEDEQVVGLDHEVQSQLRYVQP